MSVRIITLYFVIIPILFTNSKGFNVEDFEGYLKILDNYEGKTLKNVRNENDVIGDKDSVFHQNDNNKALDEVSTPLSLRFVKESMDRDSYCCSLGQIAGDKGYHCNAMFYSNDIMQRNRNRAHNRKLPFYGRDRMPHFGEKLMNKFEKCLAKKGFIFNQCCHSSALERQNLFMPQYNTFKHFLYNLRQRKT